jgi:hypothetical protein
MQRVLAHNRRGIGQHVIEEEKSILLHILSADLVEDSFSTNKTPWLHKRGRNKELLLQSQDQTLIPSILDGLCNPLL